MTKSILVTGEIWKVKSKPDYLKNVIFEVETKRERVTGDFPDQDKRSFYEPNRVEIKRSDGTIIRSRDDPEGSFRGRNSRHGMTCTWRTLAARRSIPIIPA